MDQNNSITPHQQNGLLPRVTNSLKITNKILAKTDEKLIPYRRKDKWGFCTPDKNIVIDCEFDLVDRFSEGLARVKRKDRWGFIDKKGNFVIEPKYLMARPFKEGITAVKNDNGINSWSFIDSNGITIFSNFDYLADFNEGLAPIGIGKLNHGIVEGKYGFIDKTSSIIVPIDFDYDFDDNPQLWIEEKEGQIYEAGARFKFSEGYVCLHKNNKYGFLDKNGEVIVPYIYDEANRFSNGLAEVGMVNPNNRMDRKSGYIDLNGNLTIPLKYQYRNTLATQFSEGLALVEFRSREYSYGWADKFYINNKGEVCIPESDLWEFITGFSEGFAVVRDDGKYGFIDRNGGIAIDCIYDDFWFYKTKFSDGLCLVQVNNQSFFINKLGEKVINGKDGIQYRKFYEGLSYCSIHLDGDIRIFSSETKYGYIDKSGTEFWED